MNDCLAFAIVLSKSMKCLYLLDTEICEVSQNVGHVNQLCQTHLAHLPDRAQAAATWVGLRCRPEWMVQCRAWSEQALWTVHTQTLCGVGLPQQVPDYGIQQARSCLQTVYLMLLTINPWLTKKTALDLSGPSVKFAWYRLIVI